MSGTQVRTQPDWEQIEAQYRVGTISLRKIAAEHGLTEGAIRRRARRDDWPRDLGAKVRARAEQLVRKDAVRNEVRSETPSERETVDVEAQIQARVEITQRKDIVRGRTLVRALLGELEAQTNDLDVFERLGELMEKPGDNGQDKLRDAYQKVIGFSGRVSNVKALTEAQKNLVAMERLVFKLDDPDAGDEQAKTLTDAERASRLATLLARARAAADAPDS